MLQADMGNQPYGLAFSFMEYALLSPAAASEKAAAPAGGSNLATPDSAEERIQLMGQYGMSLDEEEATLKAAAASSAETDDDIKKEGGVWTGWFLHAESDSGNPARCSFVGADGYFETSRIAFEIALSLRFDKGKLPYRGGVLTPSTAGGTVLLERLIASGVKFSLGEWIDCSSIEPPTMDV